MTEFPQRIKDHYLFQGLSERLNDAKDKIVMELVYANVRGEQVSAKVAVPVDKYPTARETVMANLLVMVEANVPLTPPKECAPCPPTVLRRNMERLPRGEQA